MNFLHASRLWLLLPVVGLVAAYLGVQLVRRRARQRYVSDHLAPVLVADRLGWRRHLPIVLALAGLAAIVVALAQPTKDVAVPRDEGVVVLAVDVSASMDATDVDPDRITAAIQGAKDFVEETPAGIHLGLVAFDGDARVLVNPTTDHEAVVNAVERLTTGPGTAAGEGIYAAVGAIKASLTQEVLAEAEAKDEDLPAGIVLLSDGVTTLGRPVVQAAAASADTGIAVTTIAFGTPDGVVAVQGELVRVPADPVTMAEAAEISGGSFHEASTAGELEDVYRDIQRVVGYRTEQREVARGVLGAAVALLVTSIALSVLWTARVL